jgi:hypothetical protein
MTYTRGTRSAVVSATVTTLYDKGRIVGVVVGDWGACWVNFGDISLAHWIYRG